MANNDRRKLDSIAAELKRKGTAVIRSAQTETERPIQHWIPHGLHFDDRDESAIVKFKREIVEANRRLDIARKTRRLEKAKETGRRWIEAGVPIFPGAFWEDLAK